jgi:hypothetical protein
MSEQTQTPSAAKSATTTSVDTATLTPQPKVAVVPIPSGATATQIAHLINQSQNVLDAANTQKASKDSVIDPASVKPLTEDYTFTDAGVVIEASSLAEAVEKLNANKKENK